VKHRPKITDVMTADPETVHVGQPLSEVYTLLRSRNFHHVPVVDGRKPVGIISATDISKLVYDVEGNDDRMLRTFLDHQFSIDDAMSVDLVTSHRDRPLRNVVDQMADGEIHSVLVLDDNGLLDGIITSTDLIRQLRDLL
jgi:CBS domain-containing protein